MPGTFHSASRPLLIVLAYSVFCAAIWLGLDELDHRLTYVHAGSDLVYQLKTERLAKSAVFPPDVPYRVVVMGSSRALSTFRPDVFDAAFDHRVFSYNFGLPGDGRFLPLLKTLLASGNRPTHVLLQEPWSTMDAPTQALPWYLDDHRLIDQLLPFRKLPRDATLFAFQSLHGGFQHEWNRVRVELTGVVDHRGWYFIKAQSQFPNDALPDDFSLPTDRPDQVQPRDLRPQGAQFEELRELARTYGFHVLVVPRAARLHESAPMADPGPQVISQSPNIASVGPNYWCLPNADFSDPVHANVPGSEAYTRRLAALLAATGEFR